MKSCQGEAWWDLLEENCSRCWIKKHGWKSRRWKRRRIHTDVQHGTALILARRRLNLSSKIFVFSIFASRALKQYMTLKKKWIYPTLNYRIYKTRTIILLRGICWELNKVTMPSNLRRFLLCLLLGLYRSGQDVHANLSAFLLCDKLSVTLPFSKV